MTNETETVQSCGCAVEPCCCVEAACACEPCTGEDCGCGCGGCGN